MNLRTIVHAAAVLFLVFAAFGWLSNDTVNWFILGLACWCASYLPWDEWGPPARRARRTE
jgi:hypothetical protein